MIFIQIERYNQINFRDTVELKTKSVEFSNVKQMDVIKTMGNLYFYQQFRRFPESTPEIKAWAYRTGQIIKII